MTLPPVFSAICCLLRLALLLLTPCAASAAAWNAPRTGNPLVPGYFADPCVMKFGDTYYLYATPDGWDLGAGPFCIWTSKDFVHWTAHMTNWPTTYQKWAPSVAFRNNTYYLYTQVPCQVWVGTSASPLGPWTNPIAGGGPFIPDQTPAGTITLDGESFIDDDGQAYLYYGTWWTPTVVKLNPDMTSTVPGSAIQFFPHAGYTPPNGTVTGCMEAPYMLKRGGKYYYMYSDGSCFDSTYNVKYSVGDSPLGPWTYGANNPVLSTNLDRTVDGPGHHTMLEEGGKSYIIYHRHDNPNHPDGVHRQIAVDELIFNPDGSIAKVAPTHDGVGYLAASTKKDTNLAAGKTATASSDAGPDWRPANAADENNGTLWKAASYTYPQWLTIDLGAVTSFKRCETEFQFPQVAYQYLIEYSTDGNSWTTFADQTTNSAQSSPMIDAKADAVSGRYVRLTMTGDSSPTRPAPEVAVWNFKVYDGVDKADPTPVVDAGPDKTGTTAFPSLPLSGGLVYATGPTTYTWSKVSGPGTVVFSDTGKLGTTVTLGAAGTYVLQLAGNDGTRTGTDTVTYTLAAAGDQIISYPMEDATGNDVADTSGNLQDGILINGPARGTGAVNQCFGFDGTNDYIHVPPLASYDALTVSAWVKPDALVGYGSILSGNGSATGAPSLSIQSDGKLHFAVVGNAAADVSSNFIFTPGIWTHVAAVYSVSGKSVAFYINGALDSTRSLTTAQNAAMTTGARIGGWDGGGRYFDGKIDELVLYNRALTAAEVAALTTGVTFAKVSDAKALPDGQAVTLKAVPVTYAPVDSNLARSTTAFYIEDADGLNGLRVENGTSGQDAAVADSGATVTGMMRTNSSTGERFLECTRKPEIESAPALTPATQTLANVTSGTDPGILVKIPGATLDSISADRKSMVISDGGANPITVLCEYGTIDTDLSAGNMADVTGVVSLTSPGTRVILLKSYWRTNPAVDPLTYKLLGYYKFDETTGTTAADLSGYGRNATVTAPAWTAGRFGNALSLNGSSTTAIIPDMGTFPAITIAGWMNLGSLDKWQSIMHCDGWNTNDVHFSFRENSGELFFSVNGNIPVDAGSGSVFNTGNLNSWKWVAVVYDSAAKSAKFYLNGTLLRTVSYSTAVAASLKNGMRVGSWGGGDRFFKGLMDELRFYGRALTDAEINTLYQANTVAITSSAGIGGSISPAGAVAVTQGGSQTFTITPATGYLIDSVTVNGASQGAITSYTFTNVTASHTISAAFKIDPGAPPAPGMTAWLKFDETAGTNAADSTGLGNLGTLNGGFTWAAGKFGNAVKLGGTDAYAALPDGALAALSDFTISAWLNLDAAPTWSRLFDFGTGTGAYMFLTPNGGPGVIRYAITTAGGGAEQQINGTAALATGSWQHVAVTLSGDTGTLYVNGQQVGQNTNMTLNPAALGNTTRNYIGKSQYNDPYLDGVVDDFRIYPRGLSATEVLALFNGNVSYADWLTRFTFTPGADTSPTGDPDGDGMINQQEFAFGLDPTQGSSSNPLTMPLESASGKFRYTRLAASGLAYHVFTSPDLRTWVEETPLNESVVATADGIETVEVTIAAPPVEGKLFVRVAAQ